MTQREGQRIFWEKLQHLANQSQRNRAKSSGCAEKLLGKGDMLLLRLVGQGWFGRKVCIARTVKSAASLNSSVSQRSRLGRWKFNSNFPDQGKARAALMKMKKQSNRRFLTASMPPAFPAEGSIIRDCSTKFRSAASENIPCEFAWTCCPSISLLGGFILHAAIACAFSNCWKLKVNRDFSSDGCC